MSPQRNVREVVVKPTYSPEYKVVIGLNLVAEAPDYLDRTLRRQPDKIVIFVQESVLNLEPTRTLVSTLRERWQVHVMSIPAGEQAKSLETALKMIEFLHNVNATKSTVVIGVGGGALGDVVGFVASVYMRGLQLVLVPTTLLSMVDSAIGGKNAINMFNIKNVVGTIYQPSLVIEDLSYVFTLPQRELCSGLAEVVKYGVTIDPELLTKILTENKRILGRDAEILLEIIERSVKCKAWVVNLDEREERDVRQILNYGHTVGHAVEACARGALTHGECVMIGMIVEADLGQELGYTEAKVVNVLTEAAARVELPRKIPRYVNREELFDKIRHDKKRFGDVLKLPVVRRLGEFEVISIKLDEFLARLEQVLPRHTE